MLSRFIHAAVWVSVSSLLLVKWIYHISFISFIKWWNVDSYPSWLLLLMPYKYSGTSFSVDMFSFLLGLHLEVKWPSHGNCSCDLLENCQTVSQSDLITLHPASPVQGFIFLYTADSNWHGLSFQWLPPWRVWNSTALWVLFEFFWWPMMWSIFSCDYCPLVYRLQRNVYSILCSLSN